MSNKERESRYRDALRYFKNAREILSQKARKKDRYYEDEKYVKMACGTAYSGVLKAIDVYLEMKGKSLRKKKFARPTVYDYHKTLAALDKKMLNEFNTSYEVLHLLGYYDGTLKADVIHSGLDSFAAILNEIKPIGYSDINLN